MLCTAWRGGSTPHPWKIFCNNLRNRSVMLIKFWILTQSSKFSCKHFLKKYFLSMSSTDVQINHSQGWSHKMRTRFCISSSTCDIDFKLCQICWGKVRFELTTWPRHNLQNRCKMRARLSISSSTGSIAF